MKKIFLLLMAITCLSSNIYSQTEKSLENKVAQNLVNQILMAPQEKIYIQTDRPYYVMGETIYFRTYLLNASTNRPAFMSRYVYVELVDANNEVVMRKQIRISSDDMYYGVLPLPETTAEGYYSIRAYTKYMQNTGEESFSNKSVFIAHSNTYRTEMITKFDFVNDHQVELTLNFKSKSTGNDINPQSIEIKRGKDVIKPTSNNDFYHKAKINIKDTDTNRTLLVDFNNGTNSFSKFISIPYYNNQPEISFFPEGGNIIAGEKNKIAFKSLLPNGDTTPMKGVVFNSKGENQTSFESEHDGMGSFFINAQAGESYYAEVNHNGKTIKVNLPEVKTDAYSLQVSKTDDKVSLSVLKGNNNATDCYLLAHFQGVPALFQAWNLSEPTKDLDFKLFKTGVNHLILLDNELNPLSERLVFFNFNDSPSVEIQTNNATAYKRQLIELDINLKDAKYDEKVPITLAVSVTDDNDVKLNSSTNIKAEILLSSELKGRINNPAWYLSQENKAANASDLLMLTHGWRNYYIEQALKGNPHNNTIQPEISQAFTGYLKDKRGRIARGSIIQISALGYDYKEAVRVDETTGYYYFNNFEFPDSTSYYLTAVDKNKTTDVEIHPNEISYPNVELPFYFPVVKVEEEVDITNYVTKANKKYTLENGIRMVNLAEVTIKAKPKKDVKRQLDNQTVYKNPVRWVSPDDFEEMPLLNFDELSHRLGLAEGAYTYIYRGREYSYDDISLFLHPEDIAQAEYFLEQGGTKRLIVLTTWPAGYIKPGEENSSYYRISTPLGYQWPVEFYSPKYDTSSALNDPTPDLRTTIYWKPNITVDNAENKASVSFYSADNKTSYSVVVEGIGSNRQFIYYRGDALIKVE
ncbi:hypothetical protein M2138_000058 [Dysgonomonadaceae bacterium PH5-43]|nr:hypothetical protein [Dysgonomonadaceae bacterium PH5-43]